MEQLTRNARMLWWQVAHNSVTTVTFNVRGVPVSFGIASLGRGRRERGFVVVNGASLLEELPPSSAHFAALLDSCKDDCVTFMGRGDNVAVTWKVKIPCTSRRCRSRSEERLGCWLRSRGMKGEPTWFFLKPLRTN
jgi:hypothetical protein